MTDILLSTLKKLAPWLIALAIILGLVFFGWSQYKQSKASYSQLITEMQIAHNVELEQYKIARDLQDAENAKSREKLYVELNRIQTQYAASQIQIQESKSKKKSDILHATGGNEEELTKMFSQVSGIPLKIMSIPYHLDEE